MPTMNEKGERLWIYPADVQGKFRRSRSVFSAFLLVLFLVMPWLRIEGRPALLLDVWNGQFSVLGFRFWAHDAPILLLVVFGGAVSLAFVTAVWGRAWCGWGCPQTVYVDMVFRRIERWIEGDGFTRKRRDAQPMNADKAFRKTLKWALYLFLSLVLSHSFLAYFAGTDRLAQMMASSPLQNPGIFTAMVALTAVIAFDLGWMREQFCIYLCPYGRFQSVLMDKRSLAVTYDHARGEPRRGSVPEGLPQGDCVSCNRCVQVCPTGIDIRNGLQLECIACTACIDACDEVMRRVRKPTGLVRYTGGGNVFQRLKGRPLAYLAIMMGAASGIFWITTTRHAVDLTLVRAIGAPYQEVALEGSGKDIVNRFNLDLQNRSFQDAKVSVAQTAGDPIQIVSADLPLVLAPGAQKRVSLFIRAPMSTFQGGRSAYRLPLSIEGDVAETRSLEVPLVGPIR
jgi:cytochrome c oxidase accessory protein FixG